jgi:hypothetical protein
MPNVHYHMLKGSLLSLKKQNKEWQTQRKWKIKTKYSSKIWYIEIVSEYVNNNSLEMKEQTIRCIKPFYWRIKRVSKLTNWKKMSHWIKQLDKLEKCMINIEFVSSFIVINGCKMCCITLITNVKWVFPSLDYDIDVLSLITYFRRLTTVYRSNKSFSLVDCNIG